MFHRNNELSRRDYIRSVETSIINEMIIDLIGNEDVRRNDRIIKRISRPIQNINKGYHSH